MEQGSGMLIIWVLSFLIAGVPTYFITKKYGANLRRDWIFLIMPTILLVPVTVVFDYGKTALDTIIIQSFVSTMIPSMVGWYVLSTKKKKFKPKEGL